MVESFGCLKKYAENTIFKEGGRRKELKWGIRGLENFYVGKPKI